MKYIYIIISCLILLSCKKQKKVSETIVQPNTQFDLINDTTKGIVSATINGNYWHGFPILDTGSKFGFTATLFKKSDNTFLPWESLSIFKIKKNLLNQIVYKTDSLLNTNPSIAKTSGFFSTKQNDGDVSCEYFEIYEKDSLFNSVTITKQVNNYTEVYGNFSLTFIKFYNCNFPHYPDTLKIKNGYFHIYLK